MHPDRWTIGLVWTFDHTMELAGVVLAGVAAVASTAAALHSHASNRHCECQLESRDQTRN